MPKDNNITNSQDENAVTNQEAESLHHNIPGDNTVNRGKEEAVTPTQESKQKQGSDSANKSVPNQANTGEPE